MITASARVAVRQPGAVRDRHGHEHARPLGAADDADRDARWPAAATTSSSGRRPTRPGGSGVRHTTVYVRADGGAMDDLAAPDDRDGGRLRRARRATPTSSSRSRSTTPATASRRRATTCRTTARSSTSAACRRSGRRTQDVGTPPEPSDVPSTNELFLAGAGEPAGHHARAAVAVRDRARAVQRRGVRHRHRPELRRHRAAGDARAARRDASSSAAAATAARCTVFDQTGGNALAPAVQLDTPIFDLEWDGSGRPVGDVRRRPAARARPGDAWQIVGRYGDGLTQALAFDAAQGPLLRLLGRRHRDLRPGHARVPPLQQRARRRPRDRARRQAVGHGVAAPRRRPDASTSAAGRRSQLRFDAAVDSLAFGRAGTPLEGLLFVSARIPSGSSEAAKPLHGRPALTLRSLAVARGGPSAEQLLATADGRLLIANGSQVDVLAPLVAPSVVKTNPVDGSIVALPLSSITVTFDRDMRRELGERARLGHQPGQLRAGQQRRRADRLHRGQLRRRVAHRHAALRVARRRPLHADHRQAHPLRRRPRADRGRTRVDLRRRAGLLAAGRTSCSSPRAPTAATAPCPSTCR